MAVAFFPSGEVAVITAGVGVGFKQVATPSVPIAVFALMIRTFVLSELVQLASTFPMTWGVSGQFGPWKPCDALNVAVFPPTVFEFAVAAFGETLTTLRHKFPDPHATVSVTARRQAHGTRAFLVIQEPPTAVLPSP